MGLKEYKIKLIPEAAGDLVPGAVPGAGAPLSLQPIPLLWPFVGPTDLGFIYGQLQGAAFLGAAQAWSGAQTFNSSLTTITGALAVTGNITSPSGLLGFSQPIAGVTGSPLALAIAVITPGADSDYSLAAAEISTPHLKLVTGSWLSGHSVIFPQHQGFWIFRNSTAFAVVCKVTTGPTIAAGMTALLFCTGGTDIQRLTADSPIT